jgi:RNA-directed DNA polymerase
MSAASMEANATGVAFSFGSRRLACSSTGKSMRSRNSITNLLHHIYAVERLEAACYAPRRDAAPGVDGQTWQSYGQALEANRCNRARPAARASG